MPKMDNIKEELIKLGATNISLKSTVSRIEFRKKKETIEIVVSLQGIMCKNKNSSDSHILPADFVNPIIDIMNIYLGGLS